MKQNDQKKARAEKKAQEEIKLRVSKTDEVLSLSTQLQELKEKRVAIEETLITERRYQQFLESILEVTDDYQEIGYIVSRFDTLSAAYEDLTNTAKRYAEEYEKALTL